MAVARRKGEAGTDASDRLKESQEAAIERLREIAENGLGEPALDGVDDITSSDVAGGAPAGDVDGSPRRAELRIVEALLFAAPEPLSEKKIAAHLPGDADVVQLLEQLSGEYVERGVHLVKVAGKWAFRTAEDLAYLLEKYAVEQRRLSKAALETLAIIAYHQPVTRAEIEDVRGVQTSRGTLDVLMETGWVRPRGRRRAPGKPVTYGTTEEFLSHFGLESLGDLPGLSDLKGAGLLGADLPPGFVVPSPKDLAALLPDELPLDEEAEEPAELNLDDEADTEADDARDDDEDGSGVALKADAPKADASERGGPVAQE